MNTNRPKGTKQPNSDPDVDPEEIMDASAEAVGPIKASPEVPVGAENLTEWDTPPGAAGRAAPEVPMEDEDSPTAQLVEEGVEQADRDRRIAAADPDQQP